MNFQVSTLAALHSIHNSEVNDIAYCQEDKKVYKYTGTEWEHMAVQSEGLEMTLYDINKMAYKQLPALTPEERNEKAKIIGELGNITKDKHYMLLCKELSYYTLFEHDSMISLPTFYGAVCEIISELGDIKSIEATADGAIEIWIDYTDDECHAFYLFPYDTGVVYFG